jgi:hypothetical protein
MPSSISSSDRRPLRRAAVVLLTLLAVFCATLEGTTRVFYGRVSRIKGRLETEHRAALTAVRRRSGAPEILVLGNSLLLHGIDYPGLQGAVAPDLTVTRFVVESTGYLDWYYGLRQIFRRGARPSAVVVVLSPRQFLSTQIQGDLFANLMLDRRDVLRVTRETGADRTGVTNLLLDGLSDFYGNRVEIRNWILQSVMPRSKQLRDALQPGAVPIREDDAAVTLAAERLERMAALAAEYGAEFILTIPPQLSSQGIGVLERAAAQTGSTLWIPVGPGALPSSSFSDGSHLNAAGAAEFTPALAHKLRSALPTTLVGTFSSGPTNSQ